MAERKHTIATREELMEKLDSLGIKTSTVDHKEVNTVFACVICLDYY